MDAAKPKTQAVATMLRMRGVLLRDGEKAVVRTAPGARRFGKPSLPFKARGLSCLSARAGANAETRKAEAVVVPKGQARHSHARA
jgi:hypothetical protein